MQWPMSPETQVPPRRAPTLLGDLGNFKSASLSLVNDGKMGMNVQIFGNLCQGANNSLEDIDCFLLSQNCLLMGAWFFCLFFFSLQNLQYRQWKGEFHRLSAVLFHFS